MSDQHPFRYVTTPARSPRAVVAPLRSGGCRPTAGGLRSFSTHLGSTTCVELSGELDVANAAELQAALTSAIGGGAMTLLLDMSLVTFCGSAALRVLVSMDRRLERRGGLLRIVDHTDGAARLLRLTELDHLLRPGHERAVG